MEVDAAPVRCGSSPKALWDVGYSGLCQDQEPLGPWACWAAEALSSEESNLLQGGVVAGFPREGLQPAAFPRHDHEGRTAGSATLAVLGRWVILRTLPACVSGCGSVVEHGCRISYPACP